MSLPKKNPSEACDKLGKYGRQEKEQQVGDGAGVLSATTATNKVLGAIALCQSTLTTKIEEVKIDVSLIRQDLSTLRDRVAETMTRISRAEDILHPFQHTTGEVRCQLQQISTKQDDMENCLRRSNL